jgi:hypothetical protein
VPTIGLTVFWVLYFHPLSAAESRRLVRRFRRGLFEHAVRVPQPPDQSSNAGHRAAAANRGRLFFGYFILAKQKKVTCCRAAPGEVDLYFYIHASTGSARTGSRISLRPTWRVEPALQKFTKNFSPGLSSPLPVSCASCA